MSFVDLGSEMSGRTEEHAVPAGEYKVRIDYAKLNHGVNGDAFIVTLALVDDPYAATVTAFVNIPSSGRDERERNRLKNRLATFLSCFELDPAVEVEDDESVPAWVGSEGWVNLKDPVDKADGYGPRNNIKSFVAGR